MKYILYARKSTEDEDRQILSIEAQLFELRQYAAKEKLVMPEADPPSAENCQRCGSAAFPDFRGGISSPPTAAKTVRTISRIDHINPFLSTIIYFK